MMVHAGHMGHVPEPEPEPEHGHHSKHDHQSKRVAIEEVAEEITIAAEVRLLSPVAP